MWRIAMVFLVMQGTHTYGQQDVKHILSNTFEQLAAQHSGDPEFLAAAKRQVGQIEDSYEAVIVSLPPSRVAVIRDRIGTWLESIPDGIYDTPLQREASLHSLSYMLKGILTIPVFDFSESDSQAAKNELSTIEDAVTSAIESRAAELFSAPQLPIIQNRVKKAVSRQFDGMVPSQLSPVFQFPLGGDRLRETLAAIQQAGAELPELSFISQFVVDRMNEGSSEQQAIFIEAQGPAISSTLTHTVRHFTSDIVEQYNSVVPEKIQAALTSATELELDQDLISRAADERAALGVAYIEDDSKRLQQAVKVTILEKAEREATRELEPTPDDIGDGPSRFTLLLIGNLVVFGILVGIWWKRSRS